MSEHSEAITAAARVIGGLGASKGGKMRALKLDAGRRFEIASNAAKARWRKCREKVVGSGGIKP